MVNLMIQVVLYSLKHCFGMSFWLDDLLCAGFDCICKKREKNLEYTDTWRAREREGALNIGLSETKTKNNKLDYMHNPDFFINKTYQPQNLGLFWNSKLQFTQLIHPTRSWYINAYVCM